MCSISFLRASSARICGKHPDAHALLPCIQRRRQHLRAADIVHLIILPEQKRPIPFKIPASRNPGPSILCTCKLLSSLSSQGCMQNQVIFFVLKQPFCAIPTAICSYRRICLPSCRYHLIHIHHRKKSVLCSKSTVRHKPDSVFCLIHKFFRQAIAQNTDRLPGIGISLTGSRCPSRRLTPSGAHLFQAMPGAHGYKGSSSPKIPKKTARYRHCSRNRHSSAF